MLSDWLARQAHLLRRLARWIAWVSVMLALFPTAGRLLVGGLNAWTRALDAAAPMLFGGLPLALLFWLLSLALAGVARWLK